MRSHKPVVGSTVSGWTKRQSGDAGIDLKKFFTHSSRGAAASKAAASGVHWASESIFARFYYREMELSTNPTVSDIKLTVVGVNE